MPSPRIAIATCAEHPDLKVDDDLLREAFRRRGCEAASVIWDEPGVDWSAFDLCLVRSTWDYHEKYDQFLDWARRVNSATTLRNPADVIAWNSDKTYLRELGERGVRTVPTAWLSRGGGADLETILADRGWEEAVVKPVVDLGAKNLRRVKVGGGEAREALEAVLARHDAIVQPFLPSLEAEGELSLVYLDGELSHAIRKRPAAGDFRVQSIWGGTVARAEAEAAHLEVAECALAQLDAVPLYARVDLVTDLEGKPCLIELELIEPNLYLNTNPTAVERLAAAVTAELS
jgi:glutathione synthase/RimK-type ligase-like ATP-grasp enzyme